MHQSRVLNWQNWVHFLILYIYKLLLISGKKVVPHILFFDVMSMFAWKELPSKDYRRICYVGLGQKRRKSTTQRQRTKKGPH